MGKSTQEMAKELGLNEKRVEEGLRTHKKEITEAISKAYAFKMAGKAVVKKRKK